MAETMFKKMLLEKKIKSAEVFSRGIAASPRLQVPDTVKELMKEENIDLSKHQPTKLTEKDVKETDLILVMENWQGVEIVQQFPQAENKTFLLKKYVEESADSADFEIYDPIGQSPGIYRLCKEEIKKCLIKLLTKLLFREEEDERELFKKRRP